jgi:MFS transporter, FSR family, fosmidomycin resistance protein
MRQHAATQSVRGRAGLLTRRLGREHRPLIANALMHLVNDGCFVAIYPILPLMAAEFHLNYAQIGLLKTSLSTSSSAFQLPMALLAERFGEITMLALGMAWVAAGLMVIGLAASFAQVLVLLFGAGLGGSVQHPVASSFVSREYDGRGRASALGVLNFAGDLGKFIVPLVFALSLAAYGWRSSLFALGAVSLLFAIVFWRLLRYKDRQHQTVVQSDANATFVKSKGWGIQRPKTFGVILAMGVLDGSVRSALLTFVPFLLIGKGMTDVQAGLMLTIIFAGGAAGKLGCGFLADKLGTAPMIVFTELCTGTFIVLLLPADAWAITPLLFCVGFFLNGTSSVLLDGVADLFDASKRSRGYGLYFTIYLGASALGPILYGMIGDAWHLPAVFFAMGAASLAIVPLTGLYHLSRATAA